MSPQPVPAVRPVRRSTFMILSMGLALGLGACGEDSEKVASDLEVPETYEFESRFEGGKSSVFYTGQTLRQVLIKAIDEQIEELTEQIDSGELKPEPGDVRAILDSYYVFDSKVSGTGKLPLETDPPLLQSTFDDIATGKDLKSKFAGNGGDTEHADWKKEFRGMDGVKSAEGLLLGLFDELDALAVARAAGEYAVDAQTPVYVTAEGINLKEMIEKLLVMAVCYTQATDKYLDEELAEATNAQSDEDGEKEPFSGLEHAWDEGFGYFGASRDFGKYVREGLSGDEDDVVPYGDADGDGKIDLLSEMNFGLPIYALKRDEASKDKTDFAGDAWRAFVAGRAIIANAGETLTDDERAALLEQRDAAVTAWENVIAANTVHYLNETLVNLSEAESGEFELTELAEHFSELKAFSLGLQLNPRSRLAGKDFDSFHAKIGSRPVLPDEGAEALSAYKAKLLEARDLLQETYGFADANVGDDSGEGGW